MNRNFEDTQYYLKRAGKAAKRGVKEELEPIRERFQNVAGGEDEPEPGRLDEIRADLKEVQEKAEGEAKEAIGEARGKIKAYRSSSD